MKHYDTPLCEWNMFHDANDVIRTSGMKKEAVGSGGNWDVASAIAESQN